MLHTVASLFAASTLRLFPKGSKLLTGLSLSDDLLINFQRAHHKRATRHSEVERMLADLSVVIQFR